MTSAPTAAVPRVFAQQAGKGNGKFYEKGSVRISYEEAGSGFAPMLLPGGGLNSTLSFPTGNSPFNAIEEFKGTVSLHHGGSAQRPTGYAQIGDLRKYRKCQRTAHRKLALSVAT
jgi:hypothetical protein